MYIESFRIDGFGIFSGVQVENLPPGLSIFLGRNEAGKSTCLEFLRSMLTGYPDPRSREAKRSYAPLRGGQAGGSLVLRADEREPLHLTRRPGSGGGMLTLSEADGGMLPPELLRQLLFGVSREVYRNVFGFSLSELESFESLSAEGVRNALYGASFGPGLRAPGDVLKILERQAEDIFKSGGSKPALNAAIRQLEELRGKIEDVAAECAGFDGLALELSRKKTALADLRRHKSELEEERRLFYVAITRAEEHCYLSFAKSRFKYGKMEFSSPSRFLKDIDVHFLKLPQEEQMARRIDERASRFCREKNERAARSLFDEPASQSSYGRSSSNISGGQKTFLVGERPKVEIIRPSIPRNLTKVGPETVSKPSAARNLSVNVQAGQVIEHERFGIGNVIKVEGIGENSKATVRFRNAGEKQLLLKFARFKVVE